MREDVPGPDRAALQELMWEHVGIERNRTGLEKALAQIAAWRQAVPREPTERDRLELELMLLTAHLMAQAALIREESRGAHYRTDFPQTDPAWRRVIVQRRP